MKTSSFVLLFSFCLFVMHSQGKQPVKIIFDTDMGPDYDDVGAIAVLHALAAQGECEILACCASDGYATIAPTIDAFNHYFNRPDLPVGSAGNNAPDFSAGNHWNDSIVSRSFKEKKTNADYPSAVAVYRKTLASQKNNSVTIITVGFVSNLANLLQSGPDEFSPLSGMDLVKKKVKRWLAMAGRFPEGGEFNVNRHPEASYYVFQHWPTPILFSGFEIGASIFTGRRLADEGSDNNPLAWAYRYNLDTYEGKKAAKRQSWDQTAVLCAVRNPEKYFYVVGPGKFVIFENGQNAWDPDTNASHYFLVHKYPYQKIAGVIDELMLYEPRP